MKKDPYEMHSEDYGHIDRRSFNFIASKLFTKKGFEIFPDVVIRDFMKELICKLYAEICREERMPLNWPSFANIRMNLVVATPEGSGPMVNVWYWKGNAIIVSTSPYLGKLNDEWRFSVKRMNISTL